MAENQVQRVNLLIELYPDIQKAYNLTQDLRSIFRKTTDILWDFHVIRWHGVNQSDLSLSIQSQDR
jgi:hypothetical protein